jgi:squalene-associated FAD-dependent desaturase
VAAIKRLAVIGGGWSGLAAAMHGAQAGHEITLFEMAPQLGGRAREVDVDGHTLDNGQHILIGAYRDTLALLKQVGVDEAAAFVRTPLRLMAPDGTGLSLPAGPPAMAFARAVLGHRGWRWRDKVGLLACAGGWALRGFRCAPARSVADLTARLGAPVRRDLIEPLCVAALNTPATQASAAVFLRVLHDALFSGPGAADLLLPRVDLGALLPRPASAWLAQAGAQLRLSRRVASVTAHGNQWRVDDEPFDGVVLATSASEAARLARPLAPRWADDALALCHEPIVTAYLYSQGARLPEAMLALREDALSPAQFVFDRGRLGGPDGLLAFVISGAQPWVDRGAEATLHAVVQQARASLGRFLGEPLQHVQLITEKRATFRCTPALRRPAWQLAPGLHAAGDYVEGPYPATLEGAVRSGIRAVASLT